MFSRVEGSSWQLKIDPKRVEEENKHVLEEDMNQISCQESRKKLPRSSKVTIHWPCRVIMSSQNGLSLFGPEEGGVRPKGNRSSLVGRAPQRATIFARLDNIKQTTIDNLQVLTRPWPKAWRILYYQVLILYYWVLTLYY